MKYCILCFMLCKGIGLLAALIQKKSLSIADNSHLFFKCMWRHVLKVLLMQRQANCKKPALI